MVSIPRCNFLSSMIIAGCAIVLGLLLLVWSADRFIAGAATIARRFGMPSLLIGMVIIGFGTSAPELMVSVLSAVQGSPGIALGNAYGSNITNIGLILGVTALLRPIAVQSRVLRQELPILTMVTVLAAWQVVDGTISRLEASVLLALFVGLLAWTIHQGMRRGGDPLGSETEAQLAATVLSLPRAVFSLTAGLLVLIASSRLLVWGAVVLAQGFGVSDLVIGLTIVAVGTSLPELASSIIAVRRGEHDLALGNIIGSNLFNTLAVVGVAGVIRPLTPGPEVFFRDIAVMAFFTVSLFAIGYGFRRPGRINRLEGGLLLLAYGAYTALLIGTVFR